MQLRDLRPSQRTQARISRGMQLVLAGMLGLAVVRGDINGIIGSGIALGITFLPAILERDYRVPLDVGLTLWLTSAVFLHQVGAEIGLYDAVWWWDHLTHGLSASVVAGAGYAAVRGVDEHSERINFPPRFVFVFVLLSVLAAGVVWEVLEYALLVVMPLLGMEPILTQHGIDDTVMDLMFNSAGAVIVATWGTVHLGGLTGAFASHLDRRAERNGR